MNEQTKLLLDYQEMAILALKRRGREINIRE